MRVFKRTHYRLVLQQPGYPLKRFTGSRELLGAAKDVLQSILPFFELLSATDEIVALDAAHINCRRIHCDVSLDNIILYRFQRSEARRGLLVNWASSITKGTPSPSTYFRTVSELPLHDVRFCSLCEIQASWAFVSGRILDENGFQPHTKEDDMESLLYVVMYAAIRWLPHESIPDLGTWIFIFFHKPEETKSADGWELGGTKKRVFMSDSGRDFLGTFEFSNPYIKLWLKAASKYLGWTDDGMWTIENLRAVTTVVHEKLLRQEETSDDRFEHSVTDYYVVAKAKEASRGTNTSRSNNKDRETGRNIHAGMLGDPIKRHREAEDVLQGPSAKRRFHDFEKY